MNIWIVCQSFLSNQIKFYSYADNTITEITEYDYKHNKNVCNNFEMKWKT